MSAWNEQMKDLHKKAGIAMDDQAQLVAYNCHAPI
jgi:hypothetical protein